MYCNILRISSVIINPLGATNSELDTVEQCDTNLDLQLPNGYACIKNGKDKQDYCSRKLPAA